MAKGVDADGSENIVAATAGVVSAIAVIFAGLQYLHQYFTSARGYAECNERVMGDWASTKKRRFAFKEFRTEVEFDAPVIFVCPPSNKNGPVLETPLYLLDGTEQSLSDTWTTTNLSSRRRYEERSSKDKVITADNERASWHVLLSAIQHMEKHSREWQEKEFQYDPNMPPPTSSEAQSLPKEPPTLEESHTFVVALQRQRRSWITMPTSITKPYATTTMCHIVEMMAALGIYWKEFDQRNDQYRAEGNGLMVLGRRIDDLGLMFSFQVNGLSRFARNRVIPVDEVKELCFGWVPTIYRSQQDKRRLDVHVDLTDLSSLRMGSKREIAELLMAIGCNNNTVNKYREDDNRTSHLFPVSFEILGMLSQAFHIENTFFTFIPNPTPERWDSRSVSLVKMMESFGRHFSQDSQDPHRNRQIAQRIGEHITIILKHLGENNVEALLRFKALHAALEDTDEILTGRPHPSRVLQDDSTASSADNVKEGDKTQSVPQNFNLRRRVTAKVGEALHVSEAPKANATKPKTPKKVNPPPVPGPETEEQHQRKETVRVVLRTHIQEVLRVLNEREERSNDGSLLVPQAWGRGGPRSRSPSPDPSHMIDSSFMEDLDSAGPDLRQDAMMKLYWKHIRPSVVRKTAKAVDRRATLNAALLSQRGNMTSGQTPLSPIQPEQPEVAPATTEAKAEPVEAKAQATAPVQESEVAAVHEQLQVAPVAAESKAAAAEAEPQDAPVTVESMAVPADAGPQNSSTTPSTETPKAAPATAGSKAATTEAKPQAKPAEPETQTTSGSKTTSKSTATLPVVVSPATGPNEGQTSQEKAEPSRGTLAYLPVSHDDIWCTLVFRMMCWLMLHDFNKADIQVPKSELLGSRMPVYVA